MFSKMIAGLRREAEMVSGVNCMMLADEYAKSKSHIQDMNGPNKTQVAGLALGSGGVLGIMGLAIANQAAAYGAAGVLTSASTALAGLGAVAVGVTILPVATVIVLGAGLAGVATIGIGALMKMVPNKIRTADLRDDDLSWAIRNNQQGMLKEIGMENIGLGAWLSGAKNLLVKSMRESVMGKDNPLVKSASPLGMNHSGVGLAAPLGAGASSLLGGSMASGKEGHACREYEIQDLFGGEAEKTKMVDAISRVAWEKHGVVVSDDRIRECLGQSQRDASFSGKILAVNEKSGLVLQSTGRGQATVHNLKDFQKIPVVGQNMDVAYKGGLMQGPKEQEQQQGAGVGR